MGFLNKLKEGASKAADMAKDSVEVVKLNAQISSKRKEIEKSYSVIGESVFQAYTSNDITLAESLIKDESAKIIALQEEIEQLDDKINFIKDEKDCTCGVIVPLDTKFCPSCGHKFEDAIVVEAAAVVVEPVEVQVELNKCTSCGSEIGQNEELCENCGNAVV
ncbi:MAG: zinc ribbon domain-containing protein [Candidatus Pristimantibacillus sp.]